MLILFDQGTLSADPPLPDWHKVRTAAQQGWDTSRI